MDIFHTHAYLPGRRPGTPGPLTRFLPPLEEGALTDWLAAHFQPGAWLLNPFGTSPRLVLEAARAGYRVLVSANNPVARFLLEVAASAPSEADLKAALAEIAIARKGDERLETHLQSLYLTPCTTCGQKVPAQAFLWRKDAEAPYARIYSCEACNEEGERLVTQADIELAKQVASTGSLHRSRVLERVAPLEDPDREYAEEALNYYLPRSIYALATLINRLEGLDLPAERRRLLTALLLNACDQANTLWPHPTERPRPKQLTVPGQFREHNVWLALEEAVNVWADQGQALPLVLWPQMPPKSGGICLFDGRLKDLTAQLDDIPIQAVIGALPRPNQAYWTLSALWAGWLWGREAVTPFKVALRRRRYDWNWHATALHAAFQHLIELLPEKTPFFGLLPEPEPSFLSAAVIAAQAAGFELQGLSMRTQHDPIQLLWQKPEKPRPDLTNPDPSLVRSVVFEHLSERGEPATYLHLYAAGLAELSQRRALVSDVLSIDEMISPVQAVIHQGLSGDKRLVRYDGSEHSLEIGLWGLEAGSGQVEPLADRVEVAVVRSLLRNPGCELIDLEREIYPQFPGLLTPAKAIVAAVLESYGIQEGGCWRLRDEDVPAVRRAELERMTGLIEMIGERLDYVTRQVDKSVLVWEQDGQPQRYFYLLASAIVGRILSISQSSPQNSLIVLPGGRASLLAYKRQRDPALRKLTEPWRFVKFRLLRTLAEIPLLTRQTWDEQIASDPIEQVKGQLMMF
jgi:hypothetical protein